ncbi:ferredoxin reductase [Pseudoxanthomonas wuyuanensis]|uniref:Ferredoxin-NADP reductase n=1 Tax=Pseudoxanthomonas wuyuanensis TaxID=1073196 RepID=A0A286CVP8_9GAMM|nr:ferredoxin reductase [Pseudoxanthomonas wuyuanensis]KAF1721305.1 ferredoxin reductase [Pseudoxanthomonas wuyuanensis]SOD50434.1 Ferredoxin-NADP reductase [Pseudoxanthomonas wuyuanensis]
MNAQIRPAGRRRPSPLKRLIRPLVKPDVFDFWASRVNRCWSWERPLARLVGREAASCDAVTLLLKPNRHWAGHRPGQHVNLGVEVDGVRMTRSYSLTAPPRADGLLSVTVKAIEGGRVSRYLCNEAMPGAVFELGQAFGGMTLASPPQDRLWLLAAGSGITPMMALVRQLAGQGMPADLALTYWVRRREEACFLYELRALAAQHPRFRLRLMLTREGAIADDEGEGRLCEGHLEGMLADALAAQQVMACGPGGFVETARILLAGRTASFQAEAFTPPPVTVVDEGEVDVRLLRSGRTLRLPRGQSLLTALEAQGLKPASGCRMGICNTCACGKSAGSTRHLPSGALDHDINQALKLCIHSAATDLELDL